MFSIDLAWLSFSVNLQLVDTWMKANAGPNYLSISADYDLTLWFSDEPEADVESAIQANWSGLTSESAEATSYQSAAQIEAAKVAAESAALASAIVKLEALGLSASEIAALSGQG